MSCFTVSDTCTGLIKNNQTTALPSILFQSERPDLNFECHYFYQILTALAPSIFHVKRYLPPPPCENCQSNSEPDLPLQCCVKIPGKMWVK